MSSKEKEKQDNMWDNDNEVCSYQEVHMCKISSNFK